MAGLEPYNLTDSPISEADEIRAQLNAENRAILKKNMWDIATALKVDPEFAARNAAAESLRNGIYNTFEDKGISGIRELRQDESSIIKLRNAADRAAPKGAQVLRGSGGSGIFRQGTAWGTHKAAVAAGAKMMGPKGAIIGDIAGDRLGRVINPGDLSRDKLIQRSLKVKGGGVPMTEIRGVGAPSNPPSFPVPPAPSNALSARDVQHLQREYTPLHSELATHYGEPIGASSYSDLEQRLI